MSLQQKINEILDERLKVLIEIQTFWNNFFFKIVRAMIKILSLREI